MELEIKWQLESRMFERWRTVPGDTKLKDVLVHFMDSAWESVKDKHIERVYGDRVVFFDEKGTKLDLDKTIQEAFPNAESGKPLKLIAAYDLRKSERTSKRKRED
jgi:hypothetical protein